MPSRTHILLTESLIAIEPSKMDHYGIFVVIPSYNEAEVVGHTVAELERYPFTIVVVDDGSRDATRECLSNTSVRYLRHCTNLGAGAATQTGTEYALAQGAQYIVHFDADGQHDAAQIYRLIEPIRSGEAEVVLGSRFLSDNDRKLVPFGKRLLLKGGVIVSWIFSGLWLTDTHVGFRALSRAAAQKIKLTQDGYAHCTEILELIRKAKLRCREVPVTVRYSEYSRKKGQKPLNSVNIVADLILRKLYR